MRYLIILLLAANIGYLIWNLDAFVEPNREDAVPGPIAQPDAEGLLLLSERAQPEPPPDTRPADRAEPVQPPATPPTTDVAAVTSQRQSDAQSVPETLARTARQERSCFTVGPFLDKENAVKVFAQMARYGYKLNVRDGDIREPAGYWVYLPSMPAKDARRIVADLDAKGMTDYFIGKNSHISLGIFSDRDKALVRQRAVKSFGYDAQLNQRYRSRDVFWLDFEQDDQEPLLGSNLWERIQREHSDVRVQRVSCD